MYTVSFFGHREIFGHANLIIKLQSIIEDILHEHDNVTFLVGNNGDFDKISAQAVRNVRNKSPLNQNCILKLVLAYKTADYQHHFDELTNQYDEIEICPLSKAVHFKSAITVRNQYIINLSDFTVFYVQNIKGGAYRTMLYAQKQHKLFHNIAV